MFYLSLFGTAFADPAVEKFELSILGASRPVMIGESVSCFPSTGMNIVSRVNPLDRSRLCRDDIHDGPFEAVGFPMTESLAWLI